MASDRDYLMFILEQLSGLDGITWRGMMGEFLLYYQGRLFGGIYDDRFLIKPTSSAKLMMPEAEAALPYEGAKEMLSVDNVEDREFLADLVRAVCSELPAPKPRGKRKETLG